MVTMAKGGSSLLRFNLGKMLNHRMTVLSVTAILAFYVVWQAGSLAWKAWLVEHESAQTAALVPPSNGNKEPALLQDLLRYPLIRSESQTAADGSASTDAPKTSLNLKLVGLMHSTDRKQARAIIESEQDGARSYSTRERVADKVEIYSIEPDRVILLHAGRREALLLDPEESSAGAEADGQAIEGSGANGSSTESQSASRANPATTSRNLDDVMSDFTATPVVEAGNLVGFRLEAVRNPELMNEWGIDPEDVITAVDGMPLNSQGRIMVLYNKLKKESEFELTLNNGGTRRTVTVELHD